MSGLGLEDFPESLNKLDTEIWQFFNTLWLEINHQGISLPQLHGKEKTTCTPTLFLVNAVKQGF